MNTTRDLLKIGLVANLFEWYEFGIYGYLAGIVGQIFFSPGDSISSLIQGFAVFAIGYLARLLGSIFFGFAGDWAGRGRALKISLIMMAAPTVLIGFLPTYNTVGVLAPVLLLVLRLVQGFAMGGELPLNGCYVFEASPAHHRSVLCSMVMVSIALGMLLASLVANLLFWYFDRETIVQWAWRLPFLLSIPLTFFIIAMRRAIHDFPVPSTKLEGRSIATSCAVLKKPMLTAVSIMSFATVFGFVLTIWLPSYLNHFLNYPPRLAQLTNTLTLIALVVFKLASGYMAHRLGYQRLVKIGLIMTILFIFPLWFRLQTLSFSHALMTQLLMALLAGSVSGILMEILASQFPSSGRSLGMNLAYTLPTVLLGSTSPLILTLMINKTGLLLFPAFYILFFGLLALPGALSLSAKSPEFPAGRL
ncbi:putative Major facilitator family transporter [Candidatus Glomeribacter gigasporarum BEG34]|uniref:Putative Major facilitator family transporter n=1 Tax=Candidatus Glomeribacter gigasporarum BEG34 TaxID=1070319 RepID=G2J8W8_9BURK|nr:MFS transporter [Candidatus Glomeribacter gigasporarum]CCD29215.1 putative Major facilitator family transporter [Candidatus Glomeribacter gigasporarum BEG34]